MRKETALKQTVSVCSEKRGIFQAHHIDSGNIIFDSLL